MPRYIESANGPVSEHDRKLLCAYMQFMFETGLRPGKEHQQLTWADCELVKQKAEVGHVGITHIHVRDDTKTGKRLAVSSEETWQVLNQIRAFSPWTKPHDPVFADRVTGKAIKTFTKGMEALLKTVGLERDRHGDKFSPYSLRHSYATDRLINGRVDVWLLAKNMGTSVEMIRKHYGHDDRHRHLCCNPTSSGIKPDGGDRNKDQRPGHCRGHFGATGIGQCPNRGVRHRGTCRIHQRNRPSGRAFAVGFHPFQRRGGAHHRADPVPVRECRQNRRNRQTDQ
ncbi:hypothetical protein MCP1_1030001 [Candidatus Terasakiella magnetica]|nr:hypothetical protein MCP1_1030001 [Candidatus Terasakiella magnetica]